jgi:predicted PurR-regulated permease PerM
VLSPIVRFARRRLKIWEPISAAVLVVGTLIVILSAFYALSGPITQIAMNAPEYTQAVERQVNAVRDRFSRLSERAANRSPEEAAAAQVGRAEEEPEPAAEDDQSQEVVVRSPSLLDNAASTVPQLGAAVLFALIFLYFLLSSGSLFHQKLIETMPTFSDKKRALVIAHEIERELSRYLFTITVINAGLGIVIGFAMWWAQMPTPAVFGALAFIFNFIPYIGAIVGMALVGVIALAEFGTLGQALIPVALYLACTSIEGQLITPTVVGRRLEMNAAAVFLAVAFWGWIWGVVGMFLAVPIMVGVKILSNYVDGLSTFGNFISSERSHVPDEDPAAK